MSESTKDAGDRFRVSLGRCFFGLATLATGVLQLAIGEFVRLVPKLPGWVPAKPALAYLVGIVFVAIGLAILTGRRARDSAAVLAAMILLDVLLLYAPTLVWNPVVDRPYLRGFMYTNPLKCFALIGGASLLAAGSANGASASSPLARALSKVAPYGALLMAVFMFVGGLQHFAYAEFVTDMVPAWLPERRFWAYFAGVALMSGAVGMLVPRTARLAATMSALMIFLWVLLLHIPRAVSLPNHAFETAGVFEALALSGVALLVAGTRTGR